MEKDKKGLESLTVVGIILILVIIFSGPLFMIGLSVMNVWPGYGMGMMHASNYDYGHMSMEDSRLSYIEHRNDIADDMRDMGDYACCLIKPCSYCIEKTPGHSEGASCHCLDDIMNGEHPCGECIGEILEGHGDKYIAMYFARAIADELGMEYLDTLKQIIAEKYDITIEEQL